VITASVQPPYSLYRLEVSPGVTNSPPVPAVHVVEVDTVTGETVGTHTLTPEQALELAAGLVAATGARP
jgi:hypothetical protein